jgi:hypothetical protein
VKSKGVKPQVERRSLPWWAVLLAGIAAGVLGIVMLASPNANSGALFRVVGLLVIVGAVVLLVSGLMHRAGRGWKVTVGILGVLLGVALIVQPFPQAFLAAALFVWIVGIGLIVLGALFLIQAFAYAGWLRGILGAVSGVVGFLLIIGSAAAPQLAPLLFGILATIAGVLGIVTAIRMRRAEPAR